MLSEVIKAGKSFQLSKSLLPSPLCGMVPESGDCDIGRGVVVTPQRERMVLKVAVPLFSKCVVPGVHDGAARF